MALRFLYFLTLFFLTSHQGFGNDAFEKFTQNGKYGLKNTTTGVVLFEAQYDDIGWSEGQFRIINNRIGLKQNEKWALATTDGSKVTRHYYSVLYPFNNNLFIIGERSNFSILNDFGVIDAKGNNIIPVEYQGITPLENGLIVSKRRGTESSYGLVSKNGNAILPLEFKNITKVDDQTLSVQQRNGLFALYSSEGKALSGFLYEMILRYGEDTYRVKYYNKEGLINRRGQTIIPPEFKSFNYRNGKAEVLPFNKWLIFSPEAEPKTVFHDNVFYVSHSKVAVQTNENSGIITLPTGDYSEYFPNSTLRKVSNEAIVLEKDGFVGAVDENGKALLIYQFDSINVFENVVFAKLQERNGQDWVPYSKNGKRVGIQLYEGYSLKPDGGFLATKNGKHGILDMEGYELTPFIFDSIGVFKNDIAVTSYQGGKGVIKPNGNWLITPYKDSIKLVNKLIYYQQGTENGIYDLFERQVFRSNNPITPFENSFAERTQDGHLLYSDAGKLLSEQRYDSIYQIDPKFLVLELKGRKQLYNTEQNQLFKLDTRVQTVRSQSEGLISIFMENHWGFVTDQGLLTIANRYQEVKDFSEGLSAVNINGSWGYIDLEDQIAIQPTLEMASPFKNGLAIIKSNGKYGLINKQGNYVLDAIYDKLIEKEGYLLLEKNGLKGFATTNGTLIRSPQFETLTTTDGIHFIVGNNQKHGVVDIEGLDRVAISFDLIKQYGSTFLAMEKQGWQNFDLK